MFITIIIFILVLSLLVFVHELGHFATARWFGVKVEEFGLGLPPRLFGVYKEEGKFKFIFGKKDLTSGPTVYSLNWIPVGGFVKIKGENGEALEDQESFASKKPWQRAIMLSAGVLMNLVLCMAVLIMAFGIGVPSVVDGLPESAQVSEQRIQVLQVVAESPAAAVDLRTGDVISQIDGQSYYNVQNLHQYLVSQEGKEVSLQIKRGAEVLDKSIMVERFDEGYIGIGVGLVETAIVKYPWYQAIWQGIKATFIWLVTIVVAFALIIKNLVMGAPTGVEVAGPVGIAVLTGQASQLGFSYLLQFIGLLSLNLAVINIMPFPALDGGRLLFLVIEKIKGKPVNQKWENLSHNIGFLLLMFLILLVTVKDIGVYGSRFLSAVSGLLGF